MSPQTITYPKRLIEVDLPIKKISEHARREKSIRQGHISTLHIWWARRPLAACRAVICASLWPDPADPLCPKEFIETARKVMDRFWNQQQVEKRELEDPLKLRQALLDFIADFANWDNSIKEEYLNPARELTQIAHESLGGEKGTRPLIVDPFAGGGSIPLEALRVGADAYASDLNPVAILLNKVILQYIPKYGTKLTDEVRKWGIWVKNEAEKELAEYYPKDPDGSIPIAYIWARTIQCEGPGCGANVPLIKNLWLGKKPNNSWSLKIITDQISKKISFEIIRGDNIRLEKEGTVKRGTVTCPICGYTTSSSSVKSQLKKKNGGTDDPYLICIVVLKPEETGRFYRIPTNLDFEIIKSASNKFHKLERDNDKKSNLIPDEPTPIGGGKGAGRAFSLHKYGLSKFSNLFTERQKLTLAVFSQKISLLSEVMDADSDLSIAVRNIIALNLDKIADYGSSLSTWSSPASQETVRNTFSRQALPIVWDFAEPSPFISSSGGWTHNLNFLISPLIQESEIINHEGEVIIQSANRINRLDDSCSAIITDPPYYDSIPYADLSDYFIIWLKRTIEDPLFHSSLVNGLSPKDNECVVDEVKGHDVVFFEKMMTNSMNECRRILTPSGVGIVVFAHKSTKGWEAQLQSLLNAGWVITGSWPIDTERAGRIRSISSAALASSIHLVCRPRENPDGSLREDIGDWREVLQELPGRIHDWMPRLASEGVVGADAIFACLGPALEIFSRYSSVEKPNGDIVTLREYLEHVWAAVAKEALSMIFTGADTSGFEEDARLTAMWLWTLSTGGPVSSDGDEDEDDESDEEESGSKKKVKGYILEYDAARKIAQGLGADLSSLPGLVEVKGEKARLLPVGERSAYLLGKSGTVFQTKGRKKKDKQVTLGGTSEDGSDVPQEVVEIGEVTPGKTTLDRIHQSMILFQAGRGEALKSFLLENARDPKFWKLAQSLSALYPPGTEEKRWVDGVLARKKGLGL